MIELEEAQQRILAAVPSPKVELVGLSESHERILAGAITSPADLPRFDNSAMDGYALRAADVAAASPETPVRLRVRGKIPAGQSFAGELAAGDCARLFTGSPLPAGADAVVMQEDTRTDAERADAVLVLDAVKPFENVRLRGTDVKSGSLLAEAGDVLTPGRISLLAASGVAEVSVGNRPIVGLLATGSELREAGQSLAPGQIHESNRLMLAALASRAGAVPRLFPLVADTPGDTRTALEAGFTQCDIVVTSGGVSVGDMDFVRAAFVEIGGRLEFWKVAVRPGRPFVFGSLGGRFLFGLPGNPVSAFVTFLLLVRPVLLRWQGAVEVNLPAHPGMLAESFSNPGDRRHFMRVRVDVTGQVFSAGLQASHALRSLASANGLVDVPPRARLSAGSSVSVMRWD
jgi:molybdopterin molybdotransferase